MELVVKNLPTNAGDLASIPRLGRSPGGGHGDPLQYSCLDNPHGQRSLVGYSPWDRKELDITEATELTRTWSNEEDEYEHLSAILRNNLAMGCRFVIKWKLEILLGYCHHVGYLLKRYADLASVCFFFFGHEACRMLVPWPGIEPVSPAVEFQSPNHWTAREVLAMSF